MFGGYTDVAAYYMDSDELADVNGDAVTPLNALPNEFLPVYTLPNPWQRGGSFEDDFILVAEFSEQEGPKPLITIPKNGGGNFDMNAFAVRILSVDHNAIGGTQSFSSDDTPVVLTEVREGAYVYVHHFALHDSQARGFVRPFCMAYVTTDESKMMTFYEEISAEFRKVSSFFKCENHSLFLKDMERYLTDLQYTHERFIKWQEAEGTLENKLDFYQPENENEELILRGTNLQAIESFIQEIKDILNAAQQRTNDRAMEEKLQKLALRPSMKRLQREQGFHDSTSLDGDSMERSNDICSKRLSNSYSSRNESLETRDQHFRDYKPNVVRTVNRRRFDKSLRTLHELCLLGAKEGLNRLRTIHQYFKRDLATLKIERTDSSLIVPKSSLLVLGRCITINFLSDKSCGSWQDSYFSDNNSLQSSLPINNLLKRWLSNETLASFKSIDSYISYKDEDSSTYSTRSSLEPLTYVTCSSYIDERESSVDSSTYLSFSTSDGLSQDFLADGRIREDTNLSGFAITQDFEEPFASATAKEFTLLDNIKTSTPDSHNTRRMQADKGKLISAADHVHNLSSPLPGSGIATFLHQYIASAHIVYSLLIGRPVVIIGRNQVEQEVRAAVTALWLFIPGHSSRNAVIPWHHRPLKIDDLSRIKLAGLCRPDNRTADYMVPCCVKRYVTVLDVEHKTLWAPPYQGGIISSFLHKKKHFKQEDTYIAYIHSVLLELAVRSFLYYHSFCVNAPSINNLSLSDSSQACKEIEKASLDFLSNLNLNSQDAKIAQYFTEMIKLQQSDSRPASVYGEKDAVSPVTKLENTICSTFKM